MNFSKALEMLKVGAKLTREGWNGKNMFIQLQKPDDKSKMTRPYVFITVPVGESKQFGGSPAGVQRVPWLTSQTDLLAEDWQEVSEEKTEQAGPIVDEPRYVPGASAQMDKE